MSAIRSLLLAIACLLASCGGGGGDGDAATSFILGRMAPGETRLIAQENLQVEFRDVSDSRCPAAAICITAGFAAVDLLVRLGAGDPQALTVTLGAGDRDRQASFAGYQFTLDKLDPFPITGPAPREQYRADITVRRL